MAANRTAQQAKGILCEALIGPLHATERLRLEIGHPVKGVDVLACQGVPSDGVDGEVTAFEIFFELGDEADRIRPPLVGVTRLMPKGRHLNRRLVDHDRDRSMLQACGIDALEQRHHLLRPSRGRDVEIAGRSIQQPISDPTSCDHGAMTGALKALAHRLREGFTHLGKSCSARFLN